jgi:peptidase E
MKLLLTSAGISTDSIQQAFTDLLTNPLYNYKVLIITIDSTSIRAKESQEREKHRIQTAGIPSENISIYDLTKGNPPSLNDVDVIYIGGGNDYHYLKYLREQSLMDKVREHVDNGGIYVGISAGSKIMGPDIDEQLTSDNNDVGLVNMKGFGLVPFYIIPHWDWREHRMNYLEYSWKTGKCIVTLTDQQAVLVEGTEIKII